MNTSRPPPRYISKEERIALNNLKKDDQILILPSDKGRCIVVVDKVAYEDKVKTLLSDSANYTKLKKDPTTKYKTELILPS